MPPKRLFSTAFRRAPPRRRCRSFDAAATCGDDDNDVVSGIISDIGADVARGGNDDDTMEDDTSFGEQTATALKNMRLSSTNLLILILLHLPIALVRYLSNLPKMDRVRRLLFSLSEFSYLLGYLDNPSSQVVRTPRAQPFSFPMILR